LKGSLPSGGVPRKRCHCGGAATINFNGQDLCPRCYSERLRELAKAEGS